MNYITLNEAQLFHNFSTTLSYKPRIIDLTLNYPLEEF